MIIAKWKISLCVFINFEFISCLTAGTDYSAVTSVATFTEANQGQAQCVTIPVIDDLICEADETVPCQLTSSEDPNDVILNPSVGLVTIIDNDGRS